MRAAVERLAGSTTGSATGSNEAVAATSGMGGKCSKILW